MNSGSSAFIGSGAQSGEAFSTSAPQFRSRPSTKGTSAPVWRRTTTVFTPATFSSALSTLAFSGTRLPARQPSSAVMTKVDSQSSIRPAMLSGEKPPKMTECTAPMRAQASMA
ncbi:hypothetical protein D3C73_711450 [compost metagenome]